MNIKSGQTKLLEIGPLNLKRLLKRLKEEVTLPLTLLINKSIKQCYVPKEWKKAKIIPFYKKKGSTLDKANYRPISLLSTYSKVIEKFINNQIVTHLEQNNLLYTNQFGFRKKKLTQSMRLTKLSNLYKLQNMHVKL